jgi:hypothetical protein
MTTDEFANVIQNEPQPENLHELRVKLQMHYCIEPSLDPCNLADAGWAIVFPARTNPVIKESLWDLLTLRQEQARERFVVYEGSNGYRPGETLKDFCSRHRISRGLAKPDQMPYYVLLVGGPDEIPYEFQYQLDAMRAVGRIHFDTLQDYANYAYYVEQAETGQIAIPRQAAFFDVANPSDPVTEMSSNYLVHPLYEKLNQEPNWQLKRLHAEQATKANLWQLLGSGQYPAFLFATSHGVEFPSEDSRQVPHQGALLCQDWPGPNEWRGEIPLDFYLARDDFSRSTNVAGLIAFLSASYSTGTPRMDRFARLASQKDKAIAPRGFVGALPKSLLSRGALAVVGHAERVWSCSTSSPETTSAPVYESTLRHLFQGDRVGWTMESIKVRYADLATRLADVLEELEWDPGFINPYDLAQLWTLCNDARSCIVIGDPAVRSPFALLDRE